jgi:hypothetical protein
MENLNLILDELKKRENGFTGDYFIPAAWETTGYNDFSVSGGRQGEIGINPYSYMIHCIENNILTGGGQKCDSIFDLNKSVIYSMLPRMLTAWDHREKGKIEGGTFLKTLCYLPYLKSLNVNMIYLLPIFEYSSMYKKGSLGSPYSIKNVYSLDANLHDSLLGSDAAMVEKEFKAFVEACHLLGMRVMVDFAFRTVARDNDLIAAHPDWFYWVKLDENREFCAPRVEGEKDQTLLDDRTIESLYKSSGIKEYLAAFTYPPDKLDAGRWPELLRRQKCTGENILELIEKEYGITTAPGFSNVLNDSQPPWTDATYLKFYFDVHEEALRYIDKSQPPVEIRLVHHPVN